MINLKHEYMMKLTNIVNSMHSLRFQVTGAGHGIGKELAIQLSDLGCIVICVDMNQDSNGRTAEFINTKVPIFHPCT